MEEAYRRQLQLELNDSSFEQSFENADQDRSRLTNLDNSLSELTHSEFLQSPSS